MAFQKFKDFNTQASSSSGGGDGIPDIIVNMPLHVGETVAVGDVVEIVNGTVRKTSCEWNLIGTPTDITSSIKVELCRVFQLSSTKFLMAYDASTPQDFGVVLLTRTGENTFSVGIPFVIGSATGYNNGDFHLEKLANGKYMLFFNGKMGAAILSINLDTGEISLNRLQIGETLSSPTASTMKVFKYSETKFIAFYGDTNNALKYMIFDVDLLTNTISTTTPTVAMAGSMGNTTGVWGFWYGTNRLVLFATSNTNLAIYYMVFELTNPSSNAAAIRNTATLEALGTSNNTYFIQGIQYAPNRALIMYSYGSSFNLRLTNIVFNPVSNTVSVDGTPTVMNMFPTNSFFLIWKAVLVGMNMVALLGRSGNANPWGVKIVICKMVQSGSLVSLIPMEALEYSYGANAPTGGDLLHFDGEGKHMLFFQDAANNNPKVMELSIRAIKPAGIALADRSAGNVPIQMQGIVTGLKGLIPGQSYRVNDDGKLACYNQASPQKVGTALTPTTLIMPELLKQNQLYN